MDDVSDPRFWEERWRSGEQGWELGAPAPPLVRALGELPVGAAAAVLGCGRGHEARLLAGLGWPRVVALDFAETALEEARRMTPESALAERIEWRQQDVFTLGRTDPGAFDLVVEHTCFCAIDPARRLEWARSVLEALRPQGVLVAVFYAHGKPDGPPFTTSASEVEAVLREAGPCRVESIEVPEDSVERRRGQELLVRARRS